MIIEIAACVHHSDNKSELNIMTSALSAKPFYTLKGTETLGGAASQSAEQHGAESAFLPCRLPVGLGR